MAKVRVVAKRDFIESATTSARPIPALAELIWNGLDSGSDSVKVVLHKDKLDGLESISVIDSGSGIDHSRVESLFGNLGESWKKETGKVNGRALHGKNGRGRFKSFALGANVQWSTIYENKGMLFAFSISGDANALDDFDVSEPIEAKIGSSGTTVHIRNLRKNFTSLQDNNASLEMAKTFAAYLTEYPQVSIEYDGALVDPAEVQLNKAEYQLEPVRIDENTIVNASLVVIEWNTSTERTIHLCDKFGVSLFELSPGQKIRAPGFHFTIYIKSDYFKELDKIGVLSLGEIAPGIPAILDAAIVNVKSHFRTRAAQQQSEIVKSWKKANIYPYEDKEDIGPIEQAERQVFDIIAVNVQSYLPSFEKSDLKSRKFTFSLLAQALKQNPESLRKILSEVLDLKKETQDELAELLKKTSLTSIISSAKVVANRLSFLNGLETLLFDKTSKKKLLERDQLHKILEKEAWIFHEEFALAASEQRLEDVLSSHLLKLGIREDSPAIVDLGEGTTGRVDLMLHRAISPRTGEYDYLVVELKRPSQKINSEVLTQIEKYAIAVANDERFHGVNVKWTFIAISNELDDFTKRKAKQRDKPKGLVFDDADLNITVWAKAWADVINEARSKLSFINERLTYEADSESAREYLKRTHLKFIPDIPAMYPEPENSTIE